MPHLAQFARRIERSEIAAQRKAYAVPVRVGIAAPICVSPEVREGLAMPCSSKSRRKELYQNKTPNRKAIRGLLN